MGSAGPRYFGFVVGGSLDAALVADLLTSGWDQNAFNGALSPASLAFEDVAGSWLKQLLGLPASASVGYVTGAGGANTVGLAAGRSHVLAAHGWDADRDGLFGAPRLRVVASVERHATVDRSLRLLGLGDGSIDEVPATANGAMDADALAARLAAGPEGPTIVCAQAGNVNTGACDDLRAIAAAAREHGAWLHVDGAFGLWAAASAKTAALVDGVELADSWGCDGHKWLNVPYDSGYAFCAHPEVHAGAMAYVASYLSGQVEGRTFGGGDFTLGVVAAGPRVRDVGGAAIARPRRRRRPHRSLLLAGPPVRRAPRRARRVRGGERRRPEPGARAGRRRGAHEWRRAARAGRRDVLARRDDVARQAAASDLGLELVDHRRRRGRERRGDPERPRSRPGGARLAVARRDGAEPLHQLADLGLGVLQLPAARAGRIVLEAGPLAPLAAGPDRPRHEPAAAVRADVGERRSAHSTQNVHS